MFLAEGWGSDFDGDVASGGEAGRRSAEVVSFDGGDEPDLDIEDGAEAALSTSRIAELGAAEQFVLTVTENGYGKRSSSYEYRTSGRGGKGIIAITVNERNGRVVAAFPVEDSDQIMLVTNGGQLIRTPVEGIRVAGRNTQGVTIFKTREAEQVVSVERVEEIAEDDAQDDGAQEGEN